MRGGLKRGREVKAAGVMLYFAGIMFISCGYHTKRGTYWGRANGHEVYRDGSSKHAYPNLRLKRGLYEILRLHVWPIQ